MSRIPECNSDLDDEDAQRMDSLWTANYRRELKSKRGRAFLREVLCALEDLPEKALVEGAVSRGGMVCTLGALALKRRTDAGQKRGVVLADLAAIVVNPLDDDGEEPEDYEPMLDWASRVLNAPRRIALEIIDRTDDDGTMLVCSDDKETGDGILVEVTPAMRYQRMVLAVRSMLEVP